MVSPTPLKLLIVDDHEVVRLGLRSLLDAERDFEVIGEAGSAAEALAQVEALRPDVVIMDIRLPDKSGIEACRLIRQRHPRIQVVILTSYLSRDLVQQALRAGAAGYVVKNVKTEELLETIRAARAGRAPLSPDRVQQVLARFSAEEEERDPALEKLSPRELQVMALVTRGLSNREIGRILNLSEGTVRNYVSSIMEKMGFRNRIEIATYAVEHRIFESTPNLGEE